MGSILHYDEKQHMKTVRQEGYEDGYDAGLDARQKEIDELNLAHAAAITDKDVEIAKLQKELEDLRNKQ